MTRTSAFLTILTLGSLATVACSRQTAPPTQINPGPATTKLGINLSGMVDWNTELPFVDVFRQSREWISQRNGASWGQGPALQRDAHGNILRLDANCYADTPMLTIDGGRYPGGIYTVTYTGQGTIDFWGAGSVVSREPGVLRVQVTPSNGHVFMRLSATNPANPIKNIRMVMPGYITKYKTEPYNPYFLNRWRGMTVIRFMDWMNTNNNPTTTWNQRATPYYANWTERGVSIEEMCRLANTLQADPWFCMPHQADDTYIRYFATTVKQHLNPRLKPYVEYSNEVWNGIFSQNQYAAQRGRAAGLATTDWEAAWRWTGRRSKQIFAIWKSVYGTQPMVRVVATQAANSWVTERILETDNVYQTTDAIAIAPYFGFTVSPDTSQPVNSTVVKNWTMPQLFNHIRTNEMPQAVQWMRDHKALANRLGLAMIAYEGGQHMVGIAGAENDDALTAKLIAANRDPAMRQLYLDYFRAWQSAGGGVFCAFSSVGSPSKWGSWGAAEHHDSIASNSPKLAGHYDFMRTTGQK